MKRHHLYAAATSFGIALIASLAAGPTGVLPDIAQAHGTFAAGDPGDPKRPIARTIEIIAREAEGKMSYTPDKIEVMRGEQIRFVIKNEGELAHPAALRRRRPQSHCRLRPARNPRAGHCLQRAAAARQEVDRRPHADPGRDLP